MTQDQAATVSEVAAATALLDLMDGYRRSAALYTFTQLGVADLLSNGPRTITELVEDTGAHGPSLARLLRAMDALGVIHEVARDQFALALLGACLRMDSPVSVADSVLMYGSEHFWHSWGDLSHSVQTGESAMRHLYGMANPFEYYAQHPEMGALAHAGFAAIARVEALAVIAVYDFPQTGTCVDVAGGQGQLLTSILHARPQARGILFDLPEVVERARPLLERAGVRHRCALEGGDIFTAVPSGGDLYLLSRVLHDWEDPQAGIILRHCHRAMPTGARLLVIEAILPEHPTASPQDQRATLADLNMLVRTGGHERTEAEYRHLLSEAGFTTESVTPTECAYSVIVATAI